MYERVLLYLNNSAPVTEDWLAVLAGEVFACWALYVEAAGVAVTTPPAEGAVPVFSLACWVHPIRKSAATKNSVINPLFN